MGEPETSALQAASDLDRVAITLSTIAYLGVDDSPPDRFKAMAKALQIQSLPTARQWGLVWGPHEHDQSLVFVAQGPVVDGRRLYAVVFRGTVDSIYNFFFDLDVWGQSPMPWTDPELPGAKLADGTIDDWDDIRNLYQSPGGRRQTLPDFLRGVDAGSTEAVTSAHVVETGLALLERAPAIARRVDAGKCAIVCATTNSTDGSVAVHGTIGAVGEVDGSLLECV